MAEKLSKQKKSRTDRSFELEADLKLAREENAQLRNELEKLRSGRCVPSAELRPTPVGEEETKKMHRAFQAMKSLLVSQEENLQSLRAELLQSRKRVGEQDQMLEYFKKQLATYKNSEKTHTGAKSASQALEKQVERLEMELDRERGETSKLQEKLQEKERVIDGLHARPENKRVQRRVSECSKTSKKASGASPQRRKSRDLSLIRRKSSCGSLTDAKSLASKRTATTATTSERSLDDAIHDARSDWGSLARKPSIRRKNSENSNGPATGTSSSTMKAKKSYDSLVRSPKTPDKKKKPVARKKSDLSMIRTTSACHGTTDADNRSVASRRTIRSVSSRSRNSAGTSGAVGMDEYQAIQKGREEKRRESSVLCLSPNNTFQGDDNHSIQEVGWNPQGSASEAVFEDNDISDTDFW